MILVGNRRETAAAFGAMILTLAGLAVAGGDSPAWDVSLPICEISTPAVRDGVDLEPAPGMRLMRVRSVSCPNRQAALPQNDTGVELATNLMARLPETLVSMQGQNEASGGGVLHRLRAQATFTLKLHPALIQQLSLADARRIPANIITLYLSTQNRDGSWRVVGHRSAVLRLQAEATYNWTTEITTQEQAPAKLELVVALPGQGAYVSLLPPELRGDPAIHPVIVVREARLQSLPCVVDPAIPGVCQ